MTEHAVVIAGGGPTGLMLAGELALAGVDVAIVERRASQDLAGSRAGGLHSRTIEVLDQRGIADRFLSEGQVAQVQRFAASLLDISDFPTRHNYGLGLWQNHIERILAGWVDELPVTIHRGREVTGFAQDDSGVDVELADGRSMRAEYLVGCDGGRSLVRRAAGIDFPGWDPSTSCLIAEVEMAEEPELGIRRDAVGIHSLGRLEYQIRDGEVVYMDGGPVRVMVTEQHLGPASEPTLRDLSEALVVVYGTDFGVHSPTWISRFTDMTRQAAAYRDRRVLLAGDAAHVHSPAGGQGLNTGVQDAVNLGWKLAQVVSRTSPESLLDTYHAERHPVAARVLRNTMAQTALMRADERIEAVRDAMAELLSMDEPRKRFAAMLSGLDIHYDLGEGHPLLGRRMPDLDLVTTGGPLRVFTLLHDARPVLLNLGEPGGFDITPWADRVQLIDATYAGPWELPVLGAVTAPTAVLIRPDGYVAWVGELTQPGLPDTLTTWFGPPSLTAYHRHRDEASNAPAPGHLRSRPGPQAARRRETSDEREPGRGDRAESPAAQVRRHRSSRVSGPAFDELLRRLVSGNVRFVLIGGFAVNAWGVVRGTKDLDVVADPDADNFTRLAEVAVAAGGHVQTRDAFVSSAAAIAALLTDGERAQIETELGPLDVVQGLAGVPPYETLRSRATDVEIAGVAISVCSLEDLRSMKRAAGRTRDLADLEDLETAHGPE